MNLLDLKYKNTLPHMTLLVILLCTAVGCRKESIDTYRTSNDIITFEEYGFKDGVTRGSMVNGFSSGYSFGAFAYSVASGDAPTSAPDIMDNIEVTLGADGLWSYSPEAYWAGNGNETHFVTYAPYSSFSNGITTESSSGYPTISYSIPTDCADQPDLMVVSKQYTEPSRSGVSFSFSHKLSAIGFLVKGDTSMTLTGVSLQGVYDEAELNYEAGAWSWGNYGNKSKSFVAGIKSTTPTSEDTPIPVTSDTGYLMMIPQSVTSAAVEISFTSEGSPFNATIPLPKNEWKAGSKYMYTITLDGRITIEILPWTELSPDDEIKDPDVNLSPDDWEGNGDQGGNLKDPDANLGVDDWEGNTDTDDSIKDPDVNLSPDDWEGNGDQGGNLTDPDANLGVDDWEGNTDTDDSIKDPDANISPDDWEDNGEQGGNLSDPDMNFDIDDWNNGNLEIEDNIKDPDANISPDDWEDNGEHNGNLSDPDANISPDDWDDNGEQGGNLSDPDMNISPDDWDDSNSDVDDNIKDPDMNVSPDDWDDNGDQGGNLSDPDINVSPDDWDDSNSDIEDNTTETIPDFNFDVDDWEGNSDHNSSFDDPNATIWPEDWSNTVLGGSI